MDKNNIRCLTNEWLKEHENDKPAAYAHVCNKLLCSEPDETLVAIKRELEHRITLDVMEEYSWEQTDTGEWRYVTPEEFSARYWADRDNKE